ncbi:carbonic anhydrase 2 [Fopius arisanus]|uniref:carbonic anhydrase n=1 Tax=Fopius arisanus TaxID=64838 RepID=A0A0C9RIG7_9HYME|nr:PREDICTED: carbonic anhydrase 2-like [Fopius arisanus]
MLWWIITTLVMLFYGVSVTKAVGLLKWPRGIQLFNYIDPESWKYNYPICNRYRQSPIDLNPDYFRYVVDSPALKWIGYDDVPDNITIFNNGHTLELSGFWPAPSIPFITGGPLRGEYLFTQLHFHWGEDNTVGSEHTTDGSSYPLEMHMVHWKRTYGSFNEALRHPDGLAVIGLFFEIDEDPERVAPLNMIFDHIGDVREANKKVNVMPFPLTVLDVIGRQFSFMSYMGSLTTPPCLESVIWILSNFVSPVSTSQMVELRKLRLRNNDRRNYRPIQPRNDRKIFFYLNNNGEPKKKQKCEARD